MILVEQMNKTSLGFFLVCIDCDLLGLNLLVFETTTIGFVPQVLSVQ